jgi:hypothetical protein
MLREHHRAQAEPRESGLVHNAGYLLLRDIKELRAWLDKLAKAAR